MMSAAEVGDFLLWEVDFDVLGLHRSLTCLYEKAYSVHAV
jgi:hypothetical protein